MNKKIYFCLIFVLTTVMLPAQSIFSFYGPAEISLVRDPHGEGMGGTGIGDTFRPNLSLINPALAATLERTYFSTALSFGNTTFSDQDNHSFQDNESNLPYFNIILPYQKHRFGLSYNNITSSVLSAKAAFINEVGDELQESRKISFSLNQAGIIYAYQNDLCNWGIGINYLFGHQIYDFKQDYHDQDLDDVINRNEKVFSQINANFSFTKQIQRISTGLVISLPANLQGTEKILTKAYTEEKEYTYTYPFQLMSGITYQVSPYIFVSTDFDYQQWSTSDNFSHPTDTFRLGTGISWTGIKNSRAWYTKIPLRTGFSIRNLPFQIAETHIYETAWHAGVSIPLKGMDNYVELSLKMFQRGKQATHGYSEDGWIMSFGLVGFDFLRKPLNRKQPRPIPKPDPGY